MEIIIILLLIILNGIFAMSEIAIVSSRKSRLQHLANQGSKSAKSALDLVNSPGKFLSTVQVGITFVGIFAGAFGGGTIARKISIYLKTIPAFSPYSDALALFLVVTGITYVSLIIGELVPKTVALSRPEKIARFVAPFMTRLSNFAFPLVSLLTFSTDLILKILRIKKSRDTAVTEEEVKFLIKEGARVGVFNLAERDIVERTFKLSDKNVAGLMTAREKIMWLDMSDDPKTLQKKIASEPHPHFPVCQGNLDKVLGVARTEELFTDFLIDKKIDFTKSLHEPNFVSGDMEALKLLEIFKLSGIHMALVVDADKNISGLISLADILDEIVGDIPDIDDLDGKNIVNRN